ncbi:MAG TPA: ATP-grasp domain-containing protein [Stellaceae bacterium]|nr:ATP-grasp domain-containing protein [Stellaceae bacterium]
MILLWGIETDTPLAMIGAALADAAVPVFFLDQQRVTETYFTIDFPGSPSGLLSDGVNEIAVETITAVYMRPFDTRRMARVERAGPASRVWSDALILDDALLCWCEMTPATVINRPSAMGSNCSKPYQSMLIQEHGFAVPDTLVTTDPVAAAEFWGLHGDVVYKSISGIRSIVSRLRPEHRERLPDVAHAPTQFQEFIAGTDVRVHVVGDELFASEIRSDADDYRYASQLGSNVEITATDMPDKLSERCRSLVASLGLLVAGIDLRRTADGRWYCFEVNPSPGFSFYEQATGQPIAQAIANLLRLAHR